MNDLLDRLVRENMGPRPPPLVPVRNGAILRPAFSLVSASLYLLWFTLMVLVMNYGFQMSAHWPVRSLDVDLNTYNNGCMDNVHWACNTPQTTVMTRVESDVCFACLSMFHRLRDAYVESQKRTTWFWGNPQNVYSFGWAHYANAACFFVYLLHIILMMLRQHAPTLQQGRVAVDLMFVRFEVPVLLLSVILIHIMFGYFIFKSIVLDLVQAMETLVDVLHHFLLYASCKWTAVFVTPVGECGNVRSLQELLTRVVGMFANNNEANTESSDLVQWSTRPQPQDSSYVVKAVADHAMRGAMGYVMYQAVSYFPRFRRRV